MPEGIFCIWTWPALLLPVLHDVSLVGQFLCRSVLPRIQKSLWRCFHLHFLCHRPSTHSALNDSCCNIWPCARHTREDCCHHVLGSNIYKRQRKQPVLCQTIASMIMPLGSATAEFLEMLHRCLITVEHVDAGNQGGQPHPLQAGQNLPAYPVSATMSAANPFSPGVSFPQQQQQQVIFPVSSMLMSASCPLIES